MDEESRKTLRELAAGIRCNESDACIGSDFQKKCRARNVGLSEFVECSEPPPITCNYVVPFGGTNFCYCPVRVHAALRLGL